MSRHYARITLGTVPVATYRKTTTGKWRAEIRRRGVYRSGTFWTRADAREWATQIEREIDTGRLGARSTKTLGDAFRRYAKEVSPKRKGRRWEQIRLKKLQADPLADIRFRDLRTEHLANWRDRRLQDVAPGSVNRELNLIGAVIAQARAVWEWTDAKPLENVERPLNPPHRDRRIADEEIQRVCWALGFDGANVTNRSHETAAAFLLALETGMRLGELTGIRRRDVHLERRYLRLLDTKNRDRRDVPLSREAVRLIRLLPEEGSRLFSVGSGSASTLFRRARLRAGIEDLTFHDSRHEACTRLARKLSVLELARMLGIRDPRTLMIYFNTTPGELAARLDADAEPSAQPRPQTSAGAGADQSAPAPESPAGK